MSSLEISDKDCEYCGGPVPKRRGPRRFCKTECTQAAKGSCTFKGHCDHPQTGNGLCGGHNQQMRRDGVLTPLAVRRGRGSPLLRDERGRKFCPGCKTWQFENNFGTHARTQDGLSARCAECNRDGVLRARFGVTLAQYEALLTEQRGVCAICREIPAEGKRNFAVDHNHRCCPGSKSCGKCVRGLLCGPCKVGIGMLREDPELFRRAAAYTAR